MLKACTNTTIAQNTKLNKQYNPKFDSRCIFSIKTSGVRITKVIMIFT